jgi:hypothetical protein
MMAAWAWSLCDEPGDAVPPLTQPERSVRSVSAEFAEASGASHVRGPRFYPVTSMTHACILRVWNSVTVGLSSSWPRRRWQSLTVCARPRRPLARKRAAGRLRLST